jgi:hypothetical protein
VAVRVASYCVGACVAGTSVGAGVDAPQALKSSANNIVAVINEKYVFVSILFSLLDIVKP